MKFKPIRIDNIIFRPSPPKKSGMPQIQPAKVRPAGDMYEIVDGHGRIDQARAAGEEEVWCQVEELDDRDFHLQSLAANLSSRDNPMKMATDIKYLIEVEGLSQSEIARMIGEVSQSLISQLYSLTRLVPELQDKLATGECPQRAGFIAAKDLPPELQLELAEAEKPTIKLAGELRDRFLADTFSLDDMPNVPDGLEHDYQPPLVLNGSTWDRLNGGDTITVEWAGLVVEVRAA